MPSAAKPLQKRYHDLDALRAFAMLLGILLHAIFVNRLLNPNSVEQASSDIFMAVLSFIHGFRMPLFFLLSGFFTLMLWKKYGSRYLITNRIKKIVLPLIIFMPICTIISFSSFIVNKDIEQTTVIDSNNTMLLTAFYQNKNVNSTTMFGFTGLQLAAISGKEKSIEWLLEMGADPNISNPHIFATMNGETALDLARLKGRTTAIAVLESHGAKAVITDKDFQAPPLINVSFSHLWFLWFLCLFITGFIFIALLCRKLTFPKLPTWLMHPILRYLLLVPLTIIFQHQMPKQWGPETFDSILVPLHLLGYYGVFFAIGALYFQWQQAQNNQNKELRFWLTELLLAILVIFPIGIVFLTNNSLPRLAYDALTSLFCWLMIFGLIGFMRRLFNQKNHTISYLSDASYFLYIAHMPILFIFGNYFTNIDLANNLKMLLNLSLTTALLLIIYNYGVRYRALGRWLNGPRIPKSAIPKEQILQNNSLS